MLYLCGMIRLIWMIMLAVAGCFALSGCDKLDDSDGGIVNEVLPGKWTFSYKFKNDADPGLEFQYKYVLFNRDGTCDLIYSEDALHGTYQTTGAMIRIVSSDLGDEERIMLWRIISLSSKQLIAEFDFDYHAQSFTAVVTLDKQN